MDINNCSTVGEILQAINGTWDVSTQDGWKCLENGNLKIYKKFVDGESPLPSKFINRRMDVIPYLVFGPDALTGGLIKLQDTAITANGLVMIIQF